MPRPPVKPEDQVVETWEVLTEGVLHVWAYDRREDRYVTESLGGDQGSMRLHITRDDRKYNQERVPIENKGLDPFTNGALRLVASETRDENLDTRYHLDDKDLTEIFEIRDADLFMEAVTGFTSELMLRRMQALGEQVGTQEQNRRLRELIDERYPIGGTQRTVREMLEAGERIGASHI